MKKIKKNPDDILIKLLENTYKYGDPYYLADLITLYKQGYQCTDCEESYDRCKCEKCNSCSYNRCLCDLNIDAKSEDTWARHGKGPSTKTVNIVRKQVLKIAEQILTNEELKFFKKKFNIDQPKSDLGFRY